MALLYCSGAPGLSLRGRVEVVSLVVVKEGRPLERSKSDEAGLAGNRTFGVSVRRARLSGDLCLDATAPSSLVSSISAPTNRMIASSFGKEADALGAALDLLRHRRPGRALLRRRMSESVPHPMNPGAVEKGPSI